MSKGFACSLQEQSEHAQLTFTSARKE